MKGYESHWIIGLIATLVWFWGDKVGIPPDAVKYAAVIVPAVVGHALAYIPGAPDPNVSAPSSGTQSQS